MTQQNAEHGGERVRVYHDEWCPLNGCRCGKCGPCAEFADCPPRVTPSAPTHADEGGA